MDSSICASSESVVWHHLFVYSSPRQICWNTLHVDWSSLRLRTSCFFRIQNLGFSGSLVGIKGGRAQKGSQEVTPPRPSYLPSTHSISLHLGRGVPGCWCLDAKEECACVCARVVCVHCGGGERQANTTMEALWEGPAVTGLLGREKGADQGLAKRSHFISQGSPFAPPPTPIHPPSLSCSRSLSIPAHS